MNQLLLSQLWVEKTFKSKIILRGKPVGIFLQMEFSRTFRFYGKTGCFDGKSNRTVLTAGNFGIKPRNKGGGGGVSVEEGDHGGGFIILPNCIFFKYCKFVLSSKWIGR